MTARIATYDWPTRDPSGRPRLAVSWCVEAQAVRRRDSIRMTPRYQRGHEHPVRNLVPHPKRPRCVTTCGVLPIESTPTAYGRHTVL